MKINCKGKFASDKISCYRAAKALIEGGLVVLPTETVYGLAADAENSEAVARIYEVKGRPSNHPVIVHIGSIEYLTKWAVDIPNYAYLVAEKFWPGPLTLILNREKIAKDFITGGQDTVAIRIPNHPTAIEILNTFHTLGGNGVVAPSANRFGAVSPTTSYAASSELGQLLDFTRDMIIDGGQSIIGIESTIVDCTGLFPEILRPGAITENMIAVASRLKTNFGNKTKKRVPGLHNKHYSPMAEILINGELNPGDGFIAMSYIPTPAGGLRLMSPKTLEEVARMIYAALSEADFIGISRIIVIPPEGDGLAIAIRDRLTRAAG